MSNLQDKCRGSLIGGSVGDALGYAVEFSALDTIRRKYGKGGITEFKLNSDNVAEFSDDTQMSLFTAESLLTALLNNKLSEQEILSTMRTGYEHWYATQTRIPYALDKSWLTHIASLWSQRAPGDTCMSALHQISFGDGSPVENNSKGCGGIMRVAPIGIFSAAHPDILDIEQAGILAGKAAEITHKHPLSTYSSMILVMIVTECLSSNKFDRSQFRDMIINKVFKILDSKYREDDKMSDIFKLILKAIELAECNKTDTESIRELGQGWIAEETLAIAIFSVMRYIDNFEKCIVCSVNHSGDSDSTGAVAGNVIGAILGYSAIPEKYITNLELHDVILSVADDLGEFSSPEQMKERYINHNPLNVKPIYLL